MEKIMIVVAGVEREATESEKKELIATWEKWAKDKEIEQEKINVRKSALAKLAALGLTEDEIAAL